MTKRRLVWAGVVLLLAVAACFILWQLFGKSNSVNLANHWRIRGGETLAEVEAILGGPPGDYTSTPGQKRFRLNVWYERSETWVSDEGMVIVGFDTDGRATGTRSFIGPGVQTPDVLERLRRWLGW